MSYGKIGLTTVAVPQDLLSGMLLVLKIELIRLWNSLLTEPGQPSAQLSKLIRLTACKAMHAISRWYRTVYIPWLVASYDTHKGKRWLNSNPPNHRDHKCCEQHSHVFHISYNHTEWYLLFSERRNRPCFALSVAYQKRNYNNMALSKRIFF